MAPDLRRRHRMKWRDLDSDVARRLIAAAEGREPSHLSQDEILAGAALRGLTWHDPASGEHYATAAGVVLLAKDPSAVFPQCRILADAYRGAEPDGDTRDHEDIRAAMPLAVERAVAFVELDLLVRKGSGRAAKYVPKEGGTA